MNSEYIKEVRLKLKLTQSEFAKLIDVSINTVRKWELGKSEPLFHNQKKIRLNEKVNKDNGILVFETG